MKTCSRCGEEQAKSEFHKEAQNKDGLGRWCKRCKKEYNQENKEKRKKYMKKYRQDNKEKRMAYQREYNKENKEKVIVYHKKYRQDNKKRIAIYKKKYYYENKEKIVARAKRYAKKNKEKVATRNANYKLVSALGITLEQKSKMLRAQGGKCSICGKKLSLCLGKDTCVDHNHETGEIRGILCRYCNTLLGHIEKNRTTLEAAIKYMHYHNNKGVSGE